MKRSTTSPRQRHRQQGGFTIVELLIVVIVIAILAGIAIVSYGGIKKNTSNSLTQDTLRKASTAVLEYKAEYDSYPSSIPLSAPVPEGVGLALTETTSETTFCINAVNANYADIQWHVDHNGDLRKGLCEGDVIVASIIGNYTTHTPTLPSDPSGNAQSSDGLLQVHTTNDWSSVTISWSDFDNKPFYELQTKNSIDDTWYIHQTTDGSYDYAPAYSNGRSGSIPSTKLAVTWTKAFPTASGVSYIYRIRSHEGSGKNPGEWHTSSELTAPGAHTYVPAIKNFKVTPDSTWSSTSITWQLPSLTSVPRPIVHLQTKGPGETEWYEHEISNGAYTYTPPQRTSGRTGGIPITTTGLSWTRRIPTASGQSYQYRIGVTDSRFYDVESAWTYVTLTGPGEEMSIPAIQNFTVTPAANWSSIAISWTKPGDTSYIPNAAYELQTKGPTDTEWYEHESNGSYTYTPPQTGSSRTGAVPITTTNISWTRRIPSSGQTFQYRIRLWSTRFQDAHSDWSTFSLTRP